LNTNEQNKKVQHKLLFMLCLTAFYMMVEIIGGLLTNSLALLADAGHMLGDSIALGMSYFAALIALKPASAQKTYGYYRTEILAALINGLLLIGVAVYIVCEGVKRALTPPEVEAPLMIAIAIGGLIINLIGLTILRSSVDYNLNIKGAFLNIMGDTLGSAGAIIAGTLIYFYKFYSADLIISFIIAALIVFSASKLALESVNILLEGAPKNIDSDAIEKALLTIDNVQKIHELHIWCISQQRVALSVHVVSDYPDSKEVLYKTDKLLRENFNIHHLTIQIEPLDFPEQHCDF